MDPYLTLYTKTNSKWIKDLNTTKTIKFLDENILGKLYDTGLGNDFLDMMPKAQATKANTDKWDYVEFKTFCASKDTINRVKKATYRGNRMGEKPMEK